MPKISTSKKTLSALLQRKTLSLSEKIKLLDYKKSNPRIGCRDIAEMFNIGKTSAATIIKNEARLRKDCASFEDNRKRIRQGKFLNEAMYLWYTKYCAANLYPTGALMQEEALLMKEKMMKQNLSLTDFMPLTGGLSPLKVLFLENAPSHPDILQEALKNIKLKFLPKNITSKLQPCDSGLIKNFKHKYRKLLIRYILARIDSVNRAAMEVINR